MAKNSPKGDGCRKGSVCGRSQVFNTRTNLYVKRDTDSGRFVGVKSTGGKYKGVRTER